MFFKLSLGCYSEISKHAVIFIILFYSKICYCSFVTVNLVTLKYITVHLVIVQLVKLQFVAVQFVTVHFFSFLSEVYCCAVDCSCAFENGCAV